MSATVAPTAANPTGGFQANVPAPTRDTEFSMRAAHQFGEKHSGYVQYSYQDWTGQNQGVGGQTLAAGRLQHRVPRRRPRRARGLDPIGRPAQPGLDGGRARLQPQPPTSPRGRASTCPGDFVSGSAQNDSFGTEYNFRLYDMVTWTRGRHMVKAGVGTPHISRRAFDDNTNALGSLHLRPHAGRRRRHRARKPRSRTTPPTCPRPSRRTPATPTSSITQQEMGAFIQDQFKINPPLLHHARHSLRLAELSGHAPAGLFAARLLRLGARRGIQDRRARRRRHLLRPLRLGPAARPGALPERPPPRRRCLARPRQRARPRLRSRDPLRDAHRAAAHRWRNLRPTPSSPTRFSTASPSSGSWASTPPAWSAATQRAASTSSARWTSTRPRRSRATPQRPNPAYCPHPPDAARRASGRATAWTSPTAAALNKYFTGFGRYTWSHYESNTGGIGWYPQNQYAPNDEWSNAGWDRRHRLGMYAMFHPESVLNLSAGIFANTGTPWTESDRHRRLRRRPLQHPSRRHRAQHRNQPELRGPGPALGPRLRLHRQQGRRSPTPRLLRRRLQRAQPRQRRRHRPGRQLPVIRRNYLRRPTPPHPTRHEIRVLGVCRK